MAFGICVGLGVITGILASLFLSFIIIGTIAPFAICYSLSNVFGIASTFFIIGPATQCKKMFKPVRLWAAVAFLVFMGLTLFAALYLANSGLTLLFVILQFCALFWYSLSYIPGARACFLGCCKKVTGYEGMNS